MNMKFPISNHNFSFFQRTWCDIDTGSNKLSNSRKLESCDGERRSSMNTNTMHNRWCAAASHFVFDTARSATSFDLT